MRLLLIALCLLAHGCSDEGQSTAETNAFIAPSIELSTQAQSEVEPQCNRSPNAGPAMTPGAGPVAMPDRIFIFAGQSNMGGFARRDELVRVPDLPNVAVWTGTQWERYTVSPCFGPEVAFLARWTADHPQQSIGFIKIAYGNTSMREWRPDWVRSEALYQALGSPFAIMMNAWQLAGALPVVAFLWAQGETDAAEDDIWPFYESRTESLIAEVRARLGFVPFVFVETQWREAPHIATIRRAQAAFDARAGSELTCMARTGDIPVYADGGVHYDTQGQLIVGERLYRRWRTC